MQLSSPAFQHQGSIPDRYTCDGENISPPLEIRDVPTGTFSLVLLMDDHDLPETAPVDVWDHWVVYNIPPDTASIVEGVSPPGVFGSNSWGKTGYGGPCPPDREHRYVFRLYALDMTLSLEAGATKQQVEEAMVGHILGQTVLIGLYCRPQNRM